MSKGLIALIIVVVIVLGALLFFGQYVGVRNTLVTKNESVKAAWSQVDIVLQRRADLIPNLVETVKGFAQQEQTVFGDIAKARSRLTLCRNTATEDRCQRSTRQRPWPTVGCSRELSAAEIKRKLPAAAG